MTALEPRRETLVVTVNQLRAERAPQSILWSMIVKMSHVLAHTGFAKCAVEEVLSSSSLADSAPVAVEYAL